MGETLMKEEQLEAIGEYVKKHIADWIKESNIIPFSEGKTASAREVSGLDISLAERMVRVEEAIKHQGELIEKILIQMDKRFEQVDKRFEDLRADMNSRFEQVDKRFEQVDKRFEQVDKRFEQVDKRFEDLRHDMNSRFNMMYKLMASGFALLAFLITLFQYI